MAVHRNTVSVAKYAHYFVTALGPVAGDRLFKILYMFRAHSAHHQEVHDANCTYAASGIVTL
jgi:hypothetical protein